MAYATPDQLRLLLRLPAFTGDDEARAQLLLDLAEGVIDDETGQALQESTDTVLLDSPTRYRAWPYVQGAGDRRLVLPRWPVKAVASVTVLGEDGTADVLDEGADRDYTWSAAGILTRVAACWPLHDRSVQVTYTAGHNPLPKSLPGIELRLAASAWSNPLPVSSESLGDHSISYSAEALGMTLSKADRRTLGLYRART
ncbi:hypothetical protein [Streptomyces sp. NPDC088789]|uniref:hypothetical protein n=1 Tax=Streptomyces sp. NPDC088789 TaxID=3365899 RepID=UPI003817B21E